VQQLLLPVSDSWSLGMDQSLDSLFNSLTIVQETLLMLLFCLVLRCLEMLYPN